MYQNVWKFQRIKTVIFEIIQRLLYDFEKYLRMKNIIIKMKKYCNSTKNVPFFCFFFFISELAERCQVKCHFRLIITSTYSTIFFFYTIFIKIIHSTEKIIVYLIGSKFSKSFKSIGLINLKIIQKLISFKIV